jgi:hypothetical protein
VPPIPLTIRWPGSVSALEDTRVTVDLPRILERDPDVLLWVWLTDPLNRLAWYADLEHVGGGTFESVDVLHLPMAAPAGEWRLELLIVSDARVSGERAITFQLDPLPFWDLSGEVPAGVELSVPQAFALRRQEGDLVSGGRVWSGAGGEVALWWAPGPSEQLSQDTAQVLLEATLPPGTDVPVELVTPLAEDEGAGFLFVERWEEGPAETLVVQSDDYWLYLLRVRAVDGPSIPALLREIQGTFRVDGMQ